MVNLTSSRLESLDISNNNPSGRVPRFLFTSRSIQLFHNHFSQLDKIRNVSRLYSLDLSSNDLFGPFSTSTAPPNPSISSPCSLNLFSSDDQRQRYYSSFSNQVILDPKYLDLEFFKGDTFDCYQVF